MLIAFHVLLIIFLSLHFSHNFCHSEIFKNIIFYVFKNIFKIYIKRLPITVP